ncbi:MAG TPA: DUF4034 domain-containing protein, partial [Phycisphaerales bacterium]|nr:DUF4034 domain-containing protein [Phycisphaerales bacterium]
MRKKIIVLALVVFIISCLLYFYSIFDKSESLQKQPTSKPKNIDRNPITIIVPDDHSTIQEAIYSAKTGDTVFVKKGVYEETITLRNGVKLIGEDKGSVIIKNDAGDKQHVILADCPNGLVENLTIEQSGDNKASARAAGICFVGSSVNINNCTIKNIPGSGILVKANSNPVISNCVIESNGYNGIQVVGTANPTIKDNVVRNNKLSGIYMAGKSTGTIEGNTCEQNNSGIIVRDGGTDVLLKNNLLRNNEKYGICVFSGANATAEGNTCEQNNQGIYITDEGTDVLLKNNQCRHNKENGIYITRTANAIAEGNICEKNKTSGIKVSRKGTTATLTKNRCTKHKYYGIALTNGSKSTAEENICETNSHAGIIVAGEETFATVRKNECSYNPGNGITVSYGASVVVEENICNENTYNGIAIRAGDLEPVLIKNQCCENKVNGIIFANGAWGRAEGNICNSNYLNGISVTSIHSYPELIDNICEDNGSLAYYYEQGQIGRIKQFLLDEDFDKLEEIAEQYRTQRTRSEDGKWLLTHFYTNLYSGWTGYRPSKKEFVLEKLNLWMKQKPDSITPRIVLGRVHISLGWFGRGGGWAKDVSEEGWKVLKEESSCAWDVLRKAEKLEHKDPELYHALMVTARVLSKPDKISADYFEKGITIDPGYHKLYIERARNLTPRWGGMPGELEKFAERAVELTKEEEGYSNYLRIAANETTHHNADGTGVFLEHNFSYRKLLQFTRHPSPSWRK